MVLVGWFTHALHTPVVLGLLSVSIQPCPRFASGTGSCLGPGIYSCHLHAAVVGKPLNGFNHHHTSNDELLTNKYTDVMTVTKRHHDTHGWWD